MSMTVYAEFEVCDDCRTRLAYGACEGCLTCYDTPDGEESACETRHAALLQFLGEDAPYAHDACPDECDHGFSYWPCAGCGASGGTLHPAVILRPAN